MARMMRSPLATRLTLLRKASGLKQEEVAAAIGLTRSAYTYYECDRSRPDCDGLIKLSKLYKVSVDALLGVAPFPDVAGYALTAADEERLVEERFLGYLEKEERLLVSLYRQMPYEQQLAMIEVFKAQNDELNL